MGRRRPKHLPTSRIPAVKTASEWPCYLVAPMGGSLRTTGLAAGLQPAVRDHLEPTRLTKAPLSLWERGLELRSTYFTLRTVTVAAWPLSLAAGISSV